MFRKIYILPLALLSLFTIISVVPAEAHPHYNDNYRNAYNNYRPAWNNVGYGYNNGYRYTSLPGNRYGYYQNRRITPNEQARLANEARQVRQLTNRYMADGRLTDKEQKRINAEMKDYRQDYKRYVNNNNRW